MDSNDNCTLESRFMWTVMTIARLKVGSECKELATPVQLNSRLMWTVRLMIAVCLEVGSCGQ